MYDDDGPLCFLFGFGFGVVIFIAAAALLHVPRDAHYTRALNDVQAACPNKQIAQYVRSYPKPFDGIEAAAKRAADACVKGRPQ